MIEKLDRCIVVGKADLEIMRPQAGLSARTPVLLFGKACGNLRDAQIRSSPVAHNSGSAGEDACIDLSHLLWSRCMKVLLHKSLGHILMPYTMPLMDSILILLLLFPCYYLGLQI